MIGLNVARSVEVAHPTPRLWARDPPPPGEGEGKHRRSRDAAASESSCKPRIAVHATPLSQAIPIKPSTEMKRREAPKCGPRHADGCCHPFALRARRAPQTSPCGDRLLRARCASRRSTAIRRPGCRPPKFLDRSRSAGSLSDRRLVRERDDRLKRRPMAYVNRKANCAGDFSKSLARAGFFRRAAAKWRRPAMACRAERRSLGMILWRGTERANPVGWVERSETHHSAGQRNDQLPA